jgi:hypothetical protein
VLYFSPFRYQFYWLVYRSNVSVKCLAQEHNIVVIYLIYFIYFNRASRTKKNAFLNLLDADYDDDVEYEDDEDYCPVEYDDADSEMDSESEADFINLEDFDNYENTSLDENDFNFEENSLPAGPSEDETLSLLCNLLIKARSLQKLARNTNNILRFMRGRQIQSKIRVEFIKDFQIRWNYTYKFLVHMLQYKSILFDLTSEWNFILNFE